MENQSAHPQHGTADQGFRPFTTAPVSSSVNAAPVMMPNFTHIQMPVYPSNSADDYYIWKHSGLKEIPGSGRWIVYECSQANCTVKKLVALSADGGHILNIVYKGDHIHPPPSQMHPVDVQTAYIPDSRYFVPSEVDVAGTSIPETEDGGEQEQLGSSSDSEEEDDGEQRAHGHVAGASATERYAVAPAERITVPTRSGTSHPKRRRKSKVWEEFTKFFIDGKIQSATCKHCESSLSAKSKGGTSHLKRHLKTCPARRGTGGVQVQLQLQQSYSHPNSSVEKNSNLDKDKSLELLTKALVSTRCSFSLPSNTNYRRFLAGICPTYDVVSQSAIQEKFLSIFENEKLKLKEEISLAPGGVFLSVAKWILESKFFICVTAHFIDEEWNMIKKVTRCSFAGSKADNADNYISMFPDLQSYLSVREWGREVEYEEEEDVEPDAKRIIKEVVRNWSMDKKLLGILFPKSLCHTDISGMQKNTADHNYLVRNTLLSLPCIVESLGQLFCNKYDMFFQGISSAWFEYMTCSPQRTEKYKEILLQLQINRPTFGSQKWYLTFYSLEAALQFNKVFPNPEQIDSKSFPFRPSDKRLQDTEVFCNIARLIYQAIQVASSPCNATLNSNFHTIWNLKIALTTTASEKARDVFCHDSMKEKFDKLWEKWYLWLSLAVVLDPRYKIRFLDRSLKQAFGSDAKRYTHEVCGKICELFFGYSVHADQQGGECSNGSNTDLQPEEDEHGSVPLHERLGELNRYLEGECVPENVPFDILKWWKGNAKTYPTLARVARDILTIPASVVSAESAFDETDERVGLFFNPKMSPEVVEALICTQDWIKSSETNDEAHGNLNIPA